MSENIQHYKYFLKDCREVKERAKSDFSLTIKEIVNDYKFKDAIQ